MIVVSLSFSSWPRPRLRPRLVTPNLMTSLGTWKKVSTWAALKWIVQGKLQCLTHTGGSIVTISALSREIREKIKGHVRQHPVNPLSEWLSKHVQIRKKRWAESGWKHQIQPGRSWTGPRCAPSEQWLWFVQLEKGIKNGAKSAGNAGRAKERTIDLLDLGMEHKMDSLRIC